MSWNVAFALGLGSEGSSYKARSKGYYQEKLKKMGEVIKTSGADIVFLQEIDWGSSRFHFIDQVQTLARESGLKYSAKALSWAINYLPFPYWPPQDHFGVMNSGGAILSRFPLSHNQVELFKKPDSQAWWYQRFYLFRYAQAVQVHIKKQNYWVVNCHLEAFDKNNRQQMAQ